MTPILEALQGDIIAAIEPLRKNFTLPVKFTFVARMPSLADGARQFWMMCEEDHQRGLVDASMILREFERVKG